MPVDPHGHDPGLELVPCSGGKRHPISMRLTKRVTAAAVCVVVVAITLVLVAQDRSKLSYSSYLEIREGMSKQQVEDILGGPPCCEKCCGYLMCGTKHSMIGGGWWPAGERWCGQRIRIYVEFSNGVVASKRYENVVRPERPGIWEALRSWLP